MNLVPFHFEQKAVRTVMLDGGLYFVARDVALILGYAKPENAISAHCKAPLKQGIPSTSGMQMTTVIPERDVYRLVMRSKLPAAQRFEEWVVGEVLPAIRRTGSYAPALNDPAALRTMLLGYTEQVIELKAQVAEQAPKVAALDRIVTQTVGSYSVREAAKSLQLPPKVFTEWLESNRWIYRHPEGGRWLAFQPRLNSGLLEHKVVSGERADGTDWGSTQVRVTAKGIARIAELLEREKAPA